MKAILARLLEQWNAASGATRAVLALSLAALLAVAGVTGWQAGNPSFRLLYSDQDAQHAAAIQSALAGGNVRFEVSQPPGPFVIWVEEGQYYQAQNLVALSGALETAPEGIPTDARGASQVFLSAPERAQSVLKREWQELEKQLQELEFVQRAHVSTSIPDASPLRRSIPPTVAVTLQLRGGTELSKPQAATVAKLVRYRFNVPADNVIISDQTGRSLYDGSAESGLGSATDLLSHKSSYDLEVAQRTNAILDRVFGPGFAYVIVHSDWSYAESELVRERLDPKNSVVVSKQESKTSAPASAPGAGTTVGGPVDISALAAPSSTLGAAGESKTSESKTASAFGRETELVRTGTPKLDRLTVSLFLDESLRQRVDDVAQMAKLEATVKNAVGYVDARDTFSSMVTPFASIPRDAEGQVLPPPPVEMESAPSPLVELLLRRGIEIASALAFLYVLFRALKGSRGRAPAAAKRERQLTEDPAYMEQLARRQIEELVRAEPEKVGTILSRWVDEERPLART